MTTTTKRPPIKETVGAQYICFATPGEFKGTYEEDIERAEIVKTVSVSENTETTPVYASGKVYLNDTTTASAEISVETIAFDSETLAKARGDKLHESGLILSGSSKNERPFFAYGKVVLYKGAYRYDWYPKCQLTANTDETKTKEESFGEQNETFTISALPFDDDGNLVARAESNLIKLKDITEEKFFSKPILTEADFKALAPEEPASKSVLKTIAESK